MYIFIWQANSPQDLRMFYEKNRNLIPRYVTVAFPVTYICWLNIFSSLGMPGIHKNIWCCYVDKKIVWYQWLTLHLAFIVSCWFECPILKLRSMCSQDVGMWQNADFLRFNAVCIFLIHVWYLMHALLPFICSIPRETSTYLADLLLGLLQRNQKDRMDFGT